MKHECALKIGRTKCSDCEFGIDDEATETLQSLQDKVERSSDLLDSN